MHRVENVENLPSWLQAVRLLPRWSCWAEAFFQQTKSTNFCWRPEISFIHHWEGNFQQHVRSPNFELHVVWCEYLNRKDNFSEYRQLPFEGSGWIQSSWALFQLLKENLIERLILYCWKATPSITNSPNLKASSPEHCASKSEIIRRFENTRLKNSGSDSILLYKINHVFWGGSKWMMLRGEKTIRLCSSERNQIAFEQIKHKEKFSMPVQRDMNFLDCTKIRKGVGIA